MTRPTDPSRPAAPTVREIAELTARLRDITARGRDVDAGERAQLLADKEALIARMTESGVATDTDAATDAGRAVATQARVDAVDAEFDDLCERHPLPGDCPGEWVTTRTGTFWHDYDDVDDNAAVGSEIATANPDIWDDDQPTERATGPAVGTGTGHRTSAARSLDSVQERREQLARWHADDQAIGQDHADGDGHDGALTRFTDGPHDAPGGTP